MDVDVGRLGELLGRWGAEDGFFLQNGVGGSTVCIIPPHSVPPVDEIAQCDGWQLWLVGLGYPTSAYPSLAEAVQAELYERALIEEQAGPDDDEPLTDDPRVSPHVG